jgi:hypothetical protein
VPQLHAPATWDTAITAAYLGAADDIYIHGAKSVTVGLVDDAGALVAGLVKIRWGSMGTSVEVPIPAGNMIALPPITIGTECLPRFRLDARVLSTSAGGDTLILLML